MQEQNGRMITVEGRAAQTGDTAVIDFEGFLDGVAFEGGKGEGISASMLFETISISLFSTSVWLWSSRRSCCFFLRSGNAALIF